MIARDRRAILLGGGLMIALVVVLRGLPATLRRAAARRDSAIERLAMAAHARATIERERALRDSLSLTLADFMSLAPRLVAGGTRADAAAALASWVGGEAGRSGLKLRRIESVLDSATGPIQPVMVRAEMEGDIAGVTGLLGSVESGPTLLSVDALSVTALDPATGPSAREVLRVEVSIRGWFQVRDAQ